MRSTETTRRPLDAAPAAAEAADLESSFRDVNGVTLHTVSAGDPDDPLVVLLHGFPECWYGWHRQIAPLVDAGFRLVVPDQRGYAWSGKPASTRAYRFTELSGDVVELIKTEGRDAAHIVGHDWGASVAWDMARRHPRRVDRLGILNVPHLSALRRMLLTNHRKLRKSWYMAFFQVPWLPEWLAARNDFRIWADLLQDATRPGAVTDEDIAYYRRAWRQDDAPRRMIDWYRAHPRYGDAPEREQVVAPTRIIWGEHDAALLPALAERSLEYCTNGELELWDDAGHFVQHDRPERVARHLIDHLNG